MSELQHRIEQLPRDRLLLLNETLRQRLQDHEDRLREPIAVVGCACRFPGATTPDAYWRLLAQGRSTVTEVPPERWNLDRYYSDDPDAEGKMYTRHGSFLDDIDLFDHRFFGLSRREVISMDPQHRLLLELSWEALERAGQANDRLEGSQTGVFFGLPLSNYIGAVEGIDQFDAYAGTGNTLCAAAGRVSYLLGLTGPTVAIDTACSTSLVTVDLACRALRDRECRLALAGGANLTLAPQLTVYFCKFGALSKTGACHTFDAKADGYVRGEGAGVVALMRLSDAEAMRAPIMGLIRGSAVGHDGKTSGLTVPSRQAQVDVIRRALQSANLQPRDVDYIEAHGTGTALGDPIEMQALGDVFKAGEPRHNPLLVGSAKTNIGHTESASGVAGLIKVLLSIRHESVPPHLNFSHPSPLIPWEDLPFKIPTHETPWKRGRRTRVAGISAFGFTGTNAHVVVEEYRGAGTGEQRLSPSCAPLTISARSPAALASLASALADEIEDGRLASDACHTLLTGRRHLPYRCSASVRSSAEAVATLREWAKVRDVLYYREVTRAARTLLVLPPIREWSGLGRQLQRQSSKFATLLQQCGRQLKQDGRAELATNLVDLDMIEPNTLPADDLTAIAAASQLCLVGLLRHWGYRPTTVCAWGGAEPAALFLADQLEWDEAVAWSLDVASAQPQCASVHDPACALVDIRNGRLIRNSEWRFAPVDEVDGLAKHLEEMEYDLIVSSGPLPQLNNVPVCCLNDGRHTNDEDRMSTLLSDLFLQGARLDWGSTRMRDSDRLVELPTYPFERERFWRDLDDTLPQHPLLGYRQPGPPTQVCHTMPWSGAPQSLQKSSIVAQRIVLLSTVAQSGCPDRAWMVHDIQPTNNRLSAEDTIWTLVGSPNAATSRIEIWSQPAGGPVADWQIAVAAQLADSEPEAMPPLPPEFHATAEQEIPGAEYAKQRWGGDGKLSQAIDRIWRVDESTIASLRLPSDDALVGTPFAIHPLIIDACLELLHLDGFSSESIARILSIRYVGPPGAMVLVSLRMTGDAMPACELTIYDLQEHPLMSVTFALKHDISTVTDGNERSAAAGIDLREAAERAVELAKMQDQEDWATVDGEFRALIVDAIDQLGPIDAQLEPREWCTQVGVQLRYEPWIRAVAPRLNATSVRPCGNGDRSADPSASVLVKLLRGDLGAEDGLDWSAFATGFDEKVEPYVQAMRALFGQRSLRVLELQAGVGSMTELLIPQLVQGEYTVTDSSAFLLSVNEQNHLALNEGKQLAPKVRYEVIDPLEAASSASRHAYDVILAFTPWYIADTPQGLLAAAARRLQPEGLFVFAIPSAHTPWMDLAYAVTQIGLRPSALALEPGNDIHGDWEHWCEQCGFDAPALLLGPEIGLPKVLMAARFRGNARATTIEKVAHNVSRDAELSRWRAMWASPPDQYYEQILRNLRAELAATLKDRKPAEIDPSSRVTELGLDSLMASELLARADPVQRWLSPSWESWANQTLGEVAETWARHAETMHSLVELSRV